MKSLPPIESAEEINNFPRLEKIFSEALRILNGEEEEQIVVGGKKGWLKKLINNLNYI